jgi:signal recognition particle receptor subunit beta
VVAIDKPEKYQEAIAVLAAMIFVHSLEKVPIVVLANKIDIN